MAETMTLCFETDVQHYALTEDELDRIIDLSNNSYKEFFIASISLGVPSIVNIFGYIKNPPEFSYPLFFNSLTGGICLLASIFLGILWYRTNKNKKAYIFKVKNKPKKIVKVMPNTSSISSTTETKNERNA